MAHFLIAVFITAFLVTGMCQNYTTLVCYDCDPFNNSVEECTHPIKNNGRTTNCQPTANTTAICISAYINHTSPNKTGIYRGCVNKPVAVDNICDWYIQERSSQNITFKSCVSCNSNRCNSILLNPDGSSSTNNVYNNNVLLLNTIILTLLALWW